MTTPEDILKARILIVDDNVANIDMFTQLLAQEGYTHVRSTSRPEEVSELHHANRYDLILLDLVMPDMDGFEVMQALRKIEKDPYLPVIVLTAEPGHKLQALQAGAKDFLSKPFDLLEVKTRIRNMLEVRLLYREMAFYNEALEGMIAERTTQLAASEARFRALTELASDWYWEQNETGEMTTVSGPVSEVLGLRASAFFSEKGDSDPGGWIESEREQLHELIELRKPFHDFAFSRINKDGTEQHFRVSGEPIFNNMGRFTGFRGIGVELRSKT